MEWARSARRAVSPAASSEAVEGPESRSPRAPDAAGRARRPSARDGGGADARSDYTRGRCRVLADPEPATVGVQARRTAQRARPAGRARYGRRRRSSPVISPGARLRVEALGVAPLALLERRVDEHLDERQARPPRGSPGRAVAVGGVGARRARRARRRRRRRSGARPAAVRRTFSARSSALKPRSPLRPWRRLSPSRQVGGAAAPRRAAARARPRPSTCPRPAGR